MAKTTWNIVVKEQKHTVTLAHAYISGKREIWVDEKPLELPPKQRGSWFDFGSSHSFHIDGCPCVIRIRTNGITFSYDLLVDGISQKTGMRVAETASDSFGWSMWLGGNKEVWFGKVEKEDTAKKILKEVLKGTLAITGITAVVFSFMGNFFAWTHVVIFGSIAFWLFKKHSVTAAQILIGLTGMTALSTIINRILPEPPFGGTNVVLSLLFLFLAIRGYQAAQWLQQHRKSA